jgi:hypothetical protein
MGNLCGGGEVNRETDLRKLFAHLDRNRNGIVTFDEFLTLETSLTKNSVNSAKSFFAKLDMDKNNALEEDEFVKAVLRNKEYSMMEDSTWNYWIRGMLKTKQHTSKELKKVGVKMKSIAYKGESATATRRREIVEGKHRNDMTADERNDLNLLQAAEHRQRQGKIKATHEAQKKVGKGKYVHRHDESMEITAEDTGMEIEEKLKRKRDRDREIMAKRFEKHSKNKGIGGNSGHGMDDDIDALISGSNRGGKKTAKKQKQ